MNKSAFIRFAWATLVVIFLVIIAGSVVRMTGSGMGCPDWPKCFGHLLPPTNEVDVQFQANTEYEKGQMIIVGEELLSAKQNFISGTEFVKQNWQVYEKHNYAKFNVAHTWTEYVNRLFGALSGFFVFVLFGWSIKKGIRSEISWWVVVITFITLVLLGFQAWLGKTVVDSHLATFKITAHLFGALALIVTMLLIIRFAQPNFGFTAFKQTKLISGITILLLLIQVYLGTDVRTLVDETTNHQGVLAVSSDLDHVFDTTNFKIHRSFAWLVLVGVSILCFKVWKNKSWEPVYSWMVAMVVLEIILGITMEKLQFPFLSQPLHLLFACILFACLFWVTIAKKTKLNR